MTGNAPSDIDFVIFWVDGNDPAHRQKRSQYLSDFSLESARNAEQSTDDKRFVQHDELRFCLRSIKQFSPWYRKIHLITDEQVPAFLDKDKLALDRIVIVDHKQLFRGKAHYLPTFNSRALATRVHHIPELSRYYLLGNDDIMLGAPVQRDFFFADGQPVIYADWTTMKSPCGETLWQRGIINGAKMMNYNHSEILVPSHGFLPFDKTLVQALETQFFESFENNLQHRFRHESQFILESLFNHFCVKNQLGRLQDTGSMVHFSFQLCREGSKEKIAFLFDLIAQGQRKMFCLNEYQSLIKRMPEVKTRVYELFPTPLLSEKGLNDVVE
ncbi:stealth family protein [Lacimicrobium sp. SS2-24]|uniref:stealth family protein n=1 Tax=Lacimicrobium sp. SS2-24 TaxID=2005569 RepID=UPI000B4B4AFE|nr:stealth family protein [Lacimicrobium sp. SS2-24]